EYRQGIRLAFLRALEFRQAYRAARAAAIREVDGARINARLVQGLERLPARGVPAAAGIGRQHHADLRLRDARAQYRHCGKGLQKPADLHRLSPLRTYSNLSISTCFRNARRQVKTSYPDCQRGIFPDASPPCSLVH